MIALTLAGALFAAAAPRAEPNPLPPAAAHILVVKHRAATRTFLPQTNAIRTMVEEGLTRFTSRPSVSTAWRSLVSTQDVVGLKVHSAPGRTSGTRPAVVAALVETLLEAGLPRTNLVIWDRRSVDLRLAGYHALAKHYGIGIAAALDEGYDPAHAYEAPLLGKLVYGDLEFGARGEGVGRRSHISRLVTERLTKIVNITPLLNHNYAGVSGALFGLTMASVDNILRFEDTQRLATAVPEIYAIPAIADKVVLCVVDALICQYQGEERTRLHDSTALNELWFGRDPVAIDVLALLELERQKGEPAKKTPGHEIYFNAELMELGTSDPGRIKVERVEVQ